jgi:hypothetical protein
MDELVVDGSEARAHTFFEHVALVEAVRSDMFCFIQYLQYMGDEI